MNTAAPPADPKPVALDGDGSGAAPTATAPRTPRAAVPPAGSVLLPPAASPVTGPAGGVRCENCGTPVTQNYCGACGQRVEPPVHSLWHFAQVAMEDLTHADSRLWRTLAALMLKPGFLTREFLAGRRAHYLPPVRLYLVLSVLFFLWASVAPHQQGVLQISVPDHGVPTAKAAKDSDLCPPGETRQQCAQRLCDVSAYPGPWRHFVTTTVHQLCVRSILDNGKSEREAFLHSLPRAMFVFLPLLAAAMMLMYWRPRHYYVEHLLLFVHNHAFIFMLLVPAGLVSAGLALLLAARPTRLVSVLLEGLSGGVQLAVTFYIAWYVFRSMRVVYGQRRWLTLGKFGLLSFFYLVSGSIMYAATLLYSAVTM